MLETSVGGTVTLIVRSLAFADIHLHSLPWHSLVSPWMLDRPVHGADGRLAITMAHFFGISGTCGLKRLHNILLDRNVLESSVLGAVISVVRSLAFTGIHSHRLAMAFARRLAASPSVDARPPRPWGGRSSR